MELSRTPYQGVMNIIRFNWHFYLLAGVLLLLGCICLVVFPWTRHWFVFVTLALAFTTLVVSLLVSYYIYDRSNLYSFPWLSAYDTTQDLHILNINAGFDETSALLEYKFKQAKLTVCDFYDAKKHTEISIKRARKAYPPYPNTIEVSTNHLPFPENTFDIVLAILSAHEIRDPQERVIFFKELRRVTSPNGKIYITEHLRDFPNFLAYTIGFFHFHARESWAKTFTEAGFNLIGEMRTTPFITTFILEPHGNTP